MENAMLYNPKLRQLTIEIIKRCRDDSNLAMSLYFNDVNMHACSHAYDDLFCKKHGIDKPNIV